MLTRKLSLALLAGLFIVPIATAAEMRGVISKVDAESKELLIEGFGRAGKGMTYVFLITDDTRILFGSNAGSNADLLVGKRTRVIYDERDGKQIALVIRPLYLQPKSKPANPVAPGGGADGILRLINSNDREIVVIGANAKGGESETTLHVPKELKVERNAKKTEFDDLKEGEQLSFEADKKNSKMYAKTLRVGPADPNGKQAQASQPEEMKREQVMKTIETVIQILEQLRRERK
jgi:Cu/Ag efflux protein CusF